MKQRTLVWTGIRVIISGLLLWFILSRIGFNTVLNNISDVPPRYVVLAIFLSILNIGISAWKWKILLFIKDIDIQYTEVFKYYYIGQFFNAFLPTAIGGDSARMYYAYSDLNAETDAFSSVAMERFTGLFAILLLGGAGAVAARDQLPSVIFYSIMGISTVGLGILTLGLFTDHLYSPLDKTFFRIDIRGIGNKFEYLYNSVINYRRAPDGLFFAFVLSLLFRVVLIINNYVVSLGLGMDLPFVFFLIFIPLAELILFIPISIQGFGVREATYVYLFSSVGASADVALSLGFIMQLILGVVNNLIGGIVYVFYVLRKRRT